jgi:U32 family peptidase
LMGNRIEVLSPAGSWESLRAAAAAGADAVYFGSGSFNARRNAENFSDEDILDVVSFCHARGIKAYFTLNTIVFDTELDKAMELAALVCKAGADAFILQDMGLASLIHSAAPQMKLHASTQMSVHNIAGVKELARLGFSRVVLSRELSKEEIAVIAKQSPVELEVFVHGALCMSVSGQCYMSAFFGGCRSGNRGLCAQPCRLPFSVGAEQNVLSLKDLSLLSDIQDLSNFGVFSAKIEGRMKRPEYVAAATAACRKAAFGQKVTAEEQEALRAIFSRDGFTTGYYDAKRDREMFGTRRHEDVISMAPSLKRFRQLYEGAECQKIKADFDFSITKSGIFLKVSDGDGNTAELAGKEPEIAKNSAIDSDTVKEKLAKTGSTPFLAGEIKTSLEPGLTVPVAEINRLRREALAILLEKRGETKAIPFKNFSKAGNPVSFLADRCKNVEKFRLRFHSFYQIPEDLDLESAEIIFLPLSQICEGKADSLIGRGAKVGAELPRAAFSGTGVISEQLLKAKELGVRDALCGNIGAVECARQAGLEIHGDYGLNVSNSEAVKAYAQSGAKSCVISFETPVSSVRGITTRKAVLCGLIVYGRLPLMLVRNCPVRSFSGCKKGGCTIKDRMGIAFPLLCNNEKDGASEILNSRPLWLADRKQEVIATGIDFEQFYFTTENAEQVKTVLEAWQKGSSCAEEFTRGLYFRPVV